LINPLLNVDRDTESCVCDWIRVRNVAQVAEEEEGEHKKSQHNPSTDASAELLFKLADARPQLSLVEAWVAVYCIVQRIVDLSQFKPLEDVK
jgi:hypothetical protein